jgi:SAM-dependent methyltransferase
MSDSDSYTRPDLISADMGGNDHELDQRMQDVMLLLECAPLDRISTVLDIGVGKGQLSEWFAKRGKHVTATGLALDSYDSDFGNLRTRYGVEIIESTAECMPFEDDCFDAVLMSHILEHVPNVGLALQEVRRVLKPGGYLLLFVPPHENLVVAGHISVGWSVGQMIYVLLVNGFDVRRGHFIEYGYNVCGFVPNNPVALPPLRSDRGDLYLLNRSALLPVPIQPSNPLADHFSNQVRAVNWPNRNHLARNDLKSRRLYRLAALVPFKHFLGRRFFDLGRFMLEWADRKYWFNPSFLKER